jgi:hypothetical protein
MIHTKIHHVIESMRERADGDPDFGKMLADAYATVPHYVLTDELMDALGSDAIESTVRALMDAGVAKLPYSHCVVELNQSTTKGEKGRAFVWFSAEPQDNTWLTHLTFMHNDGKIVCMNRGAKVLLREPADDDHKYMPPEEDQTRKSPFVFEIQPTQHSLDYPIICCLCVLMVLTHVRGVVKENVTHEHLRKLNKSRASRGRQAVLPYTVFKIGHTYTSTGEKRTWAPGCKRRPHLRAGHTRMQRYGTGRQLEKLIFIEPILVNCESEADVQHKPKVVTW